VAGVHLRRGRALHYRARQARAGGLRAALNWWAGRDTARPRECCGCARRASLRGRAGVYTAAANIAAALDYGRASRPPAGQVYAAPLDYTAARPRWPPRSLPARAALRGPGRPL